jgi:hypothetical protein
LGSFLQGFAENAARLRKQQVTITINLLMVLFVDLSSGEERKLVLIMIAAMFISGKFSVPTV